MTNNDFLFEIGTEEIPAGYINNAIEKLRDSFVQDLKEYKLSYTGIEVYSTPRRLALMISDIDRKQPSEIVEKIGPARRVAYNEANQLTKAGEGFLKSIEAYEKEIYVIDTIKGEYIAVKVFIKGKETEEILPTLCKNALEKLSFPKMMKWGNSNIMFSRPIRWLVVLYNNYVLDFNYNSLRADRFSEGHMFSEVSIENPKSYKKSLKKVRVIADRSERKEIITKQLLSIGNVHIDERLLEVVTDLVEFPTAVKAGFSKKYLTLPAKIITSTLSQNQKYFSILDENGGLSNQFVFISNGDPTYSEVIQHGNEKVVKARLEDAQFYFHEDTKHPLESYVEKLSEVVFQTNLGSMLEKTIRIAKICKYFAEIYITSIESRMTEDINILHKNKEDDQRQLDISSLTRAAKLSKADLVTMMLGEKEFAKLQGYIGMNYAMISGEKPEVAKALYEHYMPRGQNDELPSSIMGAVLAISDKLDTICGIIGVGLVPTGSNDPFALRRAGNGIVQIIDHYSLNISLLDAIKVTFEYYDDKIKDRTQSEIKVAEFIKQRIKWLLSDQYKITYDVLDALDIFKWDCLLDIKKRAVDLQLFKEQNDFELLVKGYKRVSNILDNYIARVNINPEYFIEEQELDLFNHLNTISDEISPLLSKKAYKETMKLLISLSGYLDNFFNKVLVICDDIALKENRFALLFEVKRLFLKIADISKIVYE